MYTHVCVYIYIYIHINTLITYIYIYIYNMYKRISMVSEFKQVHIDFLSPGQGGAVGRLSKFRILYLRDLRRRSLSPEGRVFQGALKSRGAP